MCRLGGIELGQDPRILPLTGLVYDMGECKEWEWDWEHQASLRKVV